MTDKKKDIKNPYTLPTKKSVWGQVKESVAPAGAGALEATGEVIGEAIFGDIVGPVVGTVATSMFVKDKEMKKLSIFLGTRKSVRNMLI